MKVKRLHPTLLGEAFMHILLIKFLPDTVATTYI